MMNSYERYEQARQLMAQGHYDEAIKLFEQNIKAHPHFKDLELLGECLMHLGRPVEATVPLAAATTLNQGVKAPSLLAQAYCLLDEKRDANEMADLALSRDPNNRTALDVKKRVTDSS